MSGGLEARAEALRSAGIDPEQLLLEGARILRALHGLSAEDPLPADEQTIAALDRLLRELHAAEVAPWTPFHFGARPMAEACAGRVELYLELLPRISELTRLFAARGYAGTSLDLIAKEAKTSKSSIFWHFENKEDLLFTVVDRAMSEWEVRAGSEILAQPDAARQLAKLVDLYRDLASERPDTLRLLLGLLLETADANEDVKRRFQRMYQGYRTSIQIVLEEGVNAGEFEPTVPSDHLAAMTLALFDGLFVQWFLDPNAVTDAVFESVKRTIFSLVTPGRAIPVPEGPRLHA